MVLPWSIGDPAPERLVRERVGSPEAMIGWAMVGIPRSDARAGDTGGAAGRGWPVPAPIGRVQAEGRGRALTSEGMAMAESDVTDRATLGEGARVEGPALIEAPTTTFLLPRGPSARVDAHGDLLVGALG